MRGFLLARAAMRLSARQQIRKSSDYVTHAEHGHGPLVTLNNMPVPRGSWASINAKKQSKYNIQLGIAVTLFAVTMGYIYANDIVYMNPKPSMKNPPLPVLKT